MPTFLLVLHRSGPRDPSRPMEAQSDWLAHAEFMDRVSGTDLE